MPKTVVVKPYSLRTIDLTKEDNIITLISDPNINKIKARYAKEQKKSNQVLTFWHGEDMVAFYVPESYPMRAELTELLSQPQEEVCQQ